MSLYFVRRSSLLHSAILLRCHHWVIDTPMSSLMVYDVIWRVNDLGLNVFDVWNKHNHNSFLHLGPESYYWDTSISSEPNVKTSTLCTIYKWFTHHSDPTVYTLSSLNTVYRHLSTSYIYIIPMCWNTPLFLFHSSIQSLSICVHLLYIFI